jgi:hypothetical protein
MERVDHTVERVVEVVAGEEMVATEEEEKVEDTTAVGGHGGH